MGKPHQTEENFWNKVNKTSGKFGIDGTFPTECWEWIGSLTTGGYGSFNVDGSTTQAHRLSWVMANGPIPDNEFVLHRCDFRPCIRPDHLFLGTQKDNIDDAMSKGRMVIPRGKDHYETLLTEAAVQSIRERHANGESQSALAKEFMLSRQAIHQIVHRKTWKHA